MSEALDDARLPQRVAAIVIGVMGIVAIVLAGVGLYGLVQYSVTRDMRDLGVRMALGCSGTDIVAVVLRRGGVLVGLGLLLGGALTAAVVPRLSGLLAGVSPFDPPTWLTVLPAFVAIGLLASGVPAFRALALRPADVLREG